MSVSLISPPSHVPVTFAMYHRPMKMQHQPHRSWLLRLRYLDNAGHPRWVITIEEPGSGRQEQVRDLQTLMKVLEEKMQGPTLTLPWEGTVKE